MLAEPFADRLLHPHLEAARIALGRCELALGRADAAGLDAAMLLLDSGRMPPLHALRLMRVIAGVRGTRGVAVWRERKRSVAQSGSRSWTRCVAIRHARRRSSAGTAIS